MKRSLCLFLLALATPPLQAQAPGKALVTREQYSACLDNADEARARQAALQKRKSDYDAASRQLQADLKAHLEARDSVKPGTRLADAWNATSLQLNARSGALNDQAGGIEKDIAEHNRLTDEARSRCSGLQVSTEDRAAVEAKRQKP